jgi:hypothetical protein
LPRKRLRNPRHTFGAIQTTAPTNTTTKPSIRSGWWKIIHTPTRARTSSEKLAIQLLTGSGLALIASRVLAFVAWAASATLPPMSAATSSSGGLTGPSARAARIAPAGTRMNVWNASHALSTYGALSAKNSTK